MNYEGMVTQFQGLSPAEKQQLQAIFRDIERRLKAAGV